MYFRRPAGLAVARQLTGLNGDSARSRTGVGSGRPAGASPGAPIELSAAELGPRALPGRNS